MDSSQIAVWQEPLRGGFYNPAMLGLKGADQLRSFFQGLSLPPPIHHLTGMTFIEAGEDLTTFTMPVSEWFLSSQGIMSAGMLAVLADGPLGCALQADLPPATPYVTSEMSVSFLRPVRAEDGDLLSWGRLIHRGDTLALTEASVKDRHGRLVAHSTSTCFILPEIQGVVPAADLQPVMRPTYDVPDPHLRPVRGEVIAWDFWSGRSGLEILRGQIAGEIPNPPIHHLTGITPIEASEGEVTFALPSTPWLCSPLGTILGGALAFFAHSTLASAVITTLPSGTAYVPVDLKVNFLRPVNPDGKFLTGRGWVAHRGKTLAVAHSEVINAEGKKVMTATGSTRILAGGRDDLT